MNSSTSIYVGTSPAGVEWVAHQRDGETIADVEARAERMRARLAKLQARHDKGTVTVPLTPAEDHFVSGLVSDCLLWHGDFEATAVGVRSSREELKRIARYAAEAEQDVHNALRRQGPAARDWYREGQAAMLHNLCAKLHKATH